MNYYNEEIEEEIKKIHNKIAQNQHLSNDDLKMLLLFELEKEEANDRK